MGICKRSLLALPVAVVDHESDTAHKQRDTEDYNREGVVAAADSVASDDGSDDGRDTSERRDKDQHEQRDVSDPGNIAEKILGGPGKDKRDREDEDLCTA